MDSDEGEEGRDDAGKSALLVDVPFGELVAMKRSGAVVHTSVATLPRGDSLRGGPGKDGSRRGSADAPKTRRSNKHRPLEVTSKRPVSRYREVVPTAASRARDPRFDTMSGRYDAVGCARSYAFLDEYREVESAQLSKQMKMV
eukprot:COSAG01_NODE_34513_length_546_cov_1.241611_1_plen_142_part_01